MKFEVGQTVKIIRGDIVPQFQNSFGTIININGEYHYINPHGFPNVELELYRNEIELVEDNMNNEFYIHVGKLLRSLGNNEELNKIADKIVNSCGCSTISEWLDKYVNNT